MAVASSRAGPAARRNDGVARQFPGRVPRGENGALSAPSEKGQHSRCTLPPPFRVRGVWPRWRGKGTVGHGALEPRPPLTWDASLVSA